ncbi:MAG: hypothetical protein ACI8V2_004450, partial [Candidatus Latescibacterota bacterium]
WTERCEESCGGVGHAVGGVDLGVKFFEGHGFFLSVCYAA